MSFKPVCSQTKTSASSFPAAQIPEFMESEEWSTKWRHAGIVLSVHVNGEAILQFFHVIPNAPASVIFGLDFLEKNNAKLDIPNQTLTTKGNQLALEGPPKCTSLLKTFQTVEVPPYAEAIFPVKVKDKQTKGQMLVEPLVSTWNKLHLMVGHVLIAN